MLTNDKITHLLETLVTDLGREDAIAYLRFALPILAQRRDTLLALLAQENWVEAATLAHKTLSSVRAYDDGRLEALLLSIEQQAITNLSQPQFQQDVREAFDTILAILEACLR